MQSIFSISDRHGLNDSFDCLEQVSIALSFSQIKSWEDDDR